MDTSAVMAKLDRLLALLDGLTARISALEEGSSSASRSSPPTARSAYRYWGTDLEDHNGNRTAGSGWHLSTWTSSNGVVWSKTNGRWVKGVSSPPVAVPKAKREQVASWTVPSSPARTPPAVKVDRKPVAASSATSWTRVLSKSDKNKEKAAIWTISQDQWSVPVLQSIDEIAGASKGVILCVGTEHFNAALEAVKYKTDCSFQLITDSRVPGASAVRLAVYSGAPGESGGVKYGVRTFWSHLVGKSTLIKNIAHVSQAPVEKHALVMISHRPKQYSSGSHWLKSKQVEQGAKEWLVKKGCGDGVIELFGGSETQYGWTAKARVACSAVAQILSISGLEETFTRVLEYTPPDTPTVTESISWLREDANYDGTWENAMQLLLKHKPSLGLAVNAAGKFGLRTDSATAHMSIQKALLGEEQAVLASLAQYRIRGLPAWYCLSSLQTLTHELKWKITPIRTFLQKGTRTWIVKAEQPPANHYVEVDNTLISIESMHQWGQRVTVRDHDSDMDGSPAGPRAKAARKGSGLAVDDDDDM